MKKTFRQFRAYRVLTALLLGTGCVWAGYGMYEDMTAYENRESGLVLNMLIMYAYDLMGKWVALSFWAMISCFVIWVFCFSPAARGAE